MHYQFLWSSKIDSQMTDIKTALSGIKIEAKPKESRSLSGEPQNDRGLSTYEEFLRATKFLKAERETPLKKRDLTKILRLEKLLAHIQAKLQEEVTAYRALYPEITHEELSQRALDLRIEKQEREAREILDRQRRWDEAAQRKEQLALILKQKDEELEALAKKCIEVEGITNCGFCKDGHEKAVCNTCSGSGHVTPRIQLLSKLVIGCCNRPTCSICAGTNTYYRDAWETTTKCSNESCVGGTVLVPCSHCQGTQVSPGCGNPLSESIVSEVGLVEKIKALLNMS